MSAREELNLIRAQSDLLFLRRAAIVDQWNLTGFAAIIGAGWSRYEEELANLAVIEEFIRDGGQLS